jgi:hypothetical protein
MKGEAYALQKLETRFYALWKLKPYLQRTIMESWKLKPYLKRTYKEKLPVQKYMTRY